MGSPGKGGSACCWEDRKAGGDRSPSLCTPQRLQLLQVGGRGTADPPPPNQPVSAEEPAGAPIRAVLVAGFGGSPSHLVPLGLGAGAAGVEGLMDPHPPFCAPPYSTASSGGGAQARGFRGWAWDQPCRRGQAIWMAGCVDSAGCSAVCAAAVQDPDCVVGACLSV